MCTSTHSFCRLYLKTKTNKKPSIYFSVPVTNNDEEAIYINKNSVLGVIHEIGKIQENIDPGIIISPHEIYLIQAFGDILNLTMLQFKISI